MSSATITPKNFKSCLSAFVSAGRKLNDRTQDFFEFAMLQASLHGNYDYAGRVVQGLHNARRYQVRNTAIAYFEAFSDIKVTFDAKKGKVTKSTKNKNGNAYVAKEDRTPYYDWVRAKADEEITADKLMKSFYALLKKTENENVPEEERIKFQAGIQRAITGGIPAEIEAA